jgi:hypothetical protein
LSVTAPKVVSVRELELRRRNCERFGDDFFDSL